MADENQRPLVSNTCVLLLAIMKHFQLFFDHHHLRLEVYPLVSVLVLAVYVIVEQMYVKSFSLSHLYHVCLLLS